LFFSYLCKPKVNPTINNIVMKRILLILVLFLIANTLPAQEEYWSNPPDLKKIENEVNSKSSPHYYPKLVKRLTACDTTLDGSDYEALYYGQAYQEGYSPYGDHDDMSAIRKMMQQDTLTPDDVEKIMKHADKYIKDNPADPQIYYYRFVVRNYSIQVHGADSGQIDDDYYRFVMLSRAFIGSGDAKSMDHAMYVVTTAHEYFFMNLMNVRMHTQHLISQNGHNYDLMELGENEEGIDSLWFDINFNWLNKTFSSNNTKTKENKAVTSVDIPLNTYFDIEIVKVKSGKSKFRVVSMESYDEIIVFDSVLNNSIPKNHIIGYFGKAKWAKDAESTNLIFKANVDGKPLSFDTDIQYHGSEKFQKTSNSGIFNGVKMNEIWHDNISAIRISNIRREK